MEASRKRGDRYLLSSIVTTAVIGVVCYLSFVLFNSFMIKPPYLAYTLFWNNQDLPKSWHFRNADDAGWQIFILCLGFITPLLELLIWVPVQACYPTVRALGAKCCAVLPPPLRNRLQARTSSAAAHGEVAVPAAFAASGMEVSSKTKPTRARMMCKKFLAYFGLSTPGSAFMMLGFITMNILTLMLPYGHRYLWLSNPDNKRLYNNFGGGESGLGAKVAMTLGRTAGWPCIMNFAISFIPVDRSSSWLAAYNVTFEEANVIHRLFAWASLFWFAVHAILYEAAYLTLGRKALLDMFFYVGPYYTSRFDYMLANVSFALMIWVSFTSLAWMRKRFYNLFRISHCLLLIVIPLGVLHRYFLLFWFEYGMMVYAADMAQRIFLHTASATAILTTVASERDAVTCAAIKLNSKHMRPDATWASKVVYLRIGAASCWESHPYSITSVEGDTIIIHIGALGDWTRRVYDIAAAAGPEGAHVPITVEGPYGCDLDGELAQADGVVLVGAGLGITPVAALVKQLASRPMWSKAGPRVPVHLWWIIRNATLAAMLPLGLLQRVASTAGIHVRVFVTSAKPGRMNDEDKAMPDVAAQGVAALAAAKHATIEMRRHSLSSADSMSSNEGDVKIAIDQIPPLSKLTHYGSNTFTNSAATPVVRPFHAFLRRFIARTVVFWIATLAVVAGFCLASQIVWKSGAGYTARSAQGVALGVQYNATVYRNMYIAALPMADKDTYLRSGALPAGAEADMLRADWPKEQVAWSRLVTNIQQESLFGTNPPNLCIGCSVTGNNPGKFPFGMGPVECCGFKVPMARAFIHVLFPPFFAFVIASLAAVLIKKLLVCYWPLYPATPPATATPSSASDESLATAKNSNKYLPPPPFSGAAAIDGNEKGKAITDFRSLKSLGGAGGVISSAQGEVQWAAGRPNFEAELEAVASSLAVNGNGGNQTLVVYCCGPAPVRESLHEAVAGGAAGHGTHVMLREFHLRD